jgi:hypothetical protein
MLYIHCFPTLFLNALLWWTKKQEELKLDGPDQLLDYADYVNVNYVNVPSCYTGFPFPWVSRDLQQKDITEENYVVTCFKLCPLDVMSQKSIAFQLAWNEQFWSTIPVAEVAAQFSYYTF